MTIRNMVDLELAGKRVLIREDLNVPVADGVVTSDVRIRAALPTIRAALDAGAAVMLMSHLGRPTEGEFDEQFSLQPVADRLAELLQREVPLRRDWIDGVEVAAGEVAFWHSSSSSSATFRRSSSSAAKPSSFLPLPPV